MFVRMYTKKKRLLFTGKRTVVRGVFILSDFIIQLDNFILHCEAKHLSCQTFGQML